MTERITKAELARRLDVKAPYISKLVKAGKLTFDADGLINYQDALKQMKNNSERMTSKFSDDKAVVETEEQPEDYKYWKTESEKWKAKQEELEFQEKQGNLIPREKVEENAFLIGNMLKEQLLSMPESLCNVFAGESDPMIIREKWIKETKRLLDDISNKLEGLSNEE